MWVGGGQNARQAGLRTGFEEDAAFTLISPFAEISRVLSRTGTIIFVASCIFWLSCSIARSADFELSGQSTRENFKSDGSKYKTSSGRFSVQKNGERWLIVFSPDAVATTEEVMFDGVDVYTLTRNMVVDKKQIARVPGREQDFLYTNGIAYAKSSTATVFSGEYPLGAKSTARLLWLAFLSGPMLSKAEPPRIPAPWGAAFMPESRSFNLSVEWPASNSGFPLRTRFVASTELWTNSFQEWKFSQVVAAPSPFEDKFVAGTYQVREWTNVDNGKENLAFPLTFELEQYFPPQLKSRSTVAERYLCEVTKAELTKPVIDRIKLKGHVDVFDYRFMDKALPWFNVAYPITNGTWKTTNDPVVRKSIESSKASFIEASSKPEHVKSPDSPPQTYARVCCVLLILSGPVVMLLVWIRKKVNVTNRKMNET